mmetsp:Transcript_290/g.901  ORF Transcript_290/g.901 Transcript_290/m.901 type:complete len:366 (+) Transcript_290:377-1474(+)
MPPPSLRDLCCHAIASELCLVPSPDSRSPRETESLVHAVSELPPEHREALWHTLVTMRLLSNTVAWFALWCPLWAASRKNLSLASCTALNGNEVAAHLSSACTALESLDLSQMAVTDGQLAVVCRACTTLTSLNLEGCHLLGGDAIKAIGSVRRLKRLSISGCWRVSTMAELCRSAQLVGLDVSGCWQLTPGVMTGVLSGLPCLTDFKANGCNQLTGESFEGLHLSASSGSLESLSLSGTQAGDGFLTWLSQGRCKGLTSLHLSAAWGTANGPPREGVTGPALSQLLAAKMTCESIPDSRPLRHLGIPGLRQWGSQDQADEGCDAAKKGPTSPCCPLAALPFPPFAPLTVLCYRPGAFANHSCSI